MTQLMNPARSIDERDSQDLLYMIRYGTSEYESVYKALRAKGIFAIELQDGLLVSNYMENLSTPDRFFSTYKVLDNALLKSGNITFQVRIDKFSLQSMTKTAFQNKVDEFFSKFNNTKSMSHTPYVYGEGQLIQEFKGGEPYKYGMVNGNFAVSCLSEFDDSFNNNYKELIINKLRNEL